MKYTVTIAALFLASAACVSPENHRRALSANDALQAQIASMAESQKQLAAENERLRAQVEDLGRRAADAAWIADEKRRIEDWLKRRGTKLDNDPNADVQLVPTPEGYAFRVKGSLLFSPGSNQLTEQGKKTLGDLVSSLKGQNLRIEGHTDDQPIQRSQWGTNLRLSVERAMAVADFLIQGGGLPQETVSVAGYGEWSPAAAGKDEAARAQNRRVEILMRQPR